MFVLLIKQVRFYMHYSLCLINSKGRDKDAEDAERDVKEWDRLRSKAMKDELWNACVDSASQALRVASHRVDIRTWRRSVVRG